MRNSPLIRKNIIPSENLSSLHLSRYGNGIDFSKSSGQIIDEVGDYEGTQHPGRCFNFDGTDDFGLISEARPNPFDLQYVEMECFLMMIEQPESKSLTIFSNTNASNEGYSLLIQTSVDTNTNHRVYFQYWNTSGSLTNSYVTIPKAKIPLNTWVKVKIAAYGTMKVYINDVEEGSLAGTGGNIGYGLSNTRRVELGRRGDGIVPWKGYLYNVKINELNSSGAFVKNIAHYKCEDADGTTAYDSSGNGYHATLNNITTSSFHNTTLNDIYSYLYELGYSNGTGNVLIPRNEANPDFDVLGNPLQFKGRVKANLDLRDSNCANIHSTAIILNMPASTLATGDTMTYSGTATAALDIANNRITFSGAGTFYNVSIKDSASAEKLFIACSEGRELTLHDSINSVKITVTNATEVTFWNTKQNTYHHNLQFGNSEYYDSTNAKTLRIPFKKDKTPVVSPTIPVGYDLVAHYYSNPQALIPCETLVHKANTNIPALRYLKDGLKTTERFDELVSNGGAEGQTDWLDNSGIPLNWAWRTSGVAGEVAYNTARDGFNSRFVRITVPASSTSSRVVFWQNNQSSFMPFRNGDKIFISFSYRSSKDIRFLPDTSGSGWDFTVVHVTANTGNAILWERSITVTDTTKPTNSIAFDFGNTGGTGGGIGDWLELDEVSMRVVRNFEKNSNNKKSNILLYKADPTDHQTKRIKSFTNQL